MHLYECLWKYEVTCIRKCTSPCFPYLKTRGETSGYLQRSVQKLCICINALALVIIITWALKVLSTSCVPLLALHLPPLVMSLHVGWMRMIHLNKVGICISHCFHLVPVHRIEHSSLKQASPYNCMVTRSSRKTTSLYCFQFSQWGIDVFFPLSQLDFSFPIESTGNLSGFLLDWASNFQQGA